jgi:exonuclease VII small subunit
MNAAQLKGDLKHIEDAVTRADAPQPVKRLLGELIEWNRGLIDQAVADSGRVDALEAAVDDLLEGVSEGIMPETAQVIMTALEQARHVCATVAALLESDKNPLDDVTTKSFALLIRGCAKSVEVARETVQEIVISEEGEDEEGEDDGEEGEDEDEGEPSEETGGEEIQEDTRG